MESKKKSNSKTIGLSNFTRLHKEDSRRRLIEAAYGLFNSQGYAAVSIDDIAKEAGVTRQTFYRHFDGKFEIAFAYFEREAEIALPFWLAIRDENFLDREVVRRWLHALFSHYEDCSKLLHTYLELNALESKVQVISAADLPTLIKQLGTRIPAFAKAQDGQPGNRRQWIKAFLLLWQLREQCQFNASGYLCRDKDDVIECSVDLFLQFVAADG